MLGGSYPTKMGVLYAQNNVMSDSGLGFRVHGYKYIMGMNIDIDGTINRALG